MPDPITSPTVLEIHSPGRADTRDLAAILALPAMWLGHDPASIASDLAAILVSMLRLKWAYVRFTGSGQEPLLECWFPNAPQPPEELMTWLANRDLRLSEAASAMIASPVHGCLRIAQVAPAIPGEGGLVIASSDRPDFPNAGELYLLHAAVGQATVSIGTARLLAEQRAVRAAAQQALHERNAFLIELAHDLDGAVETLSAFAARARQLAAAPAAPPVSISSNQKVSNQKVARPDGAVLASPEMPRLTRREGEVLGLLAQGLSNKDIATILCLSDRTIERHITGVYRKIRVERRSEAIAFALHHHLAE